MKLKIKFMSSDTIDLDFESDNPTIIDVKNKLSEIKNTEISTIKLIFSGKILDDDKDLKYYKIDESHQIICMIRKNPPQTQAQTQPSPQTESVQNQQVPLNINHPPPLQGMQGMQGFNLPNMAGLGLGGMPTPEQFNSVQNMYGSGGMPSPEQINTLQSMFQNPQMSQMMGSIMENPQMKEMMINMTLQRMNIPLDSPMRSLYENMITSFFNNPTQNLNAINQMQNSNPELFNMINNMTPTNINQNMPSNPPTIPQVQPSTIPSTSHPSTIPPVQPSTIPSTIPTTTSDTPSTNTSTQPTLNIEEIKEKYSDQIEEIKMMGFEDESKIIEAIAQSYGSVSIALNKLLE